MAYCVDRDELGPVDHVTNEMVGEVYVVLWKWHTAVNIGMPL